MVILIVIVNNYGNTTNGNKDTYYYFIISNYGNSNGGNDGIDCYFHQYL